MLLSDRFWLTIKAIAILWSMCLQGQLVGIVAVIAVTRKLVITMRPYL